MKPRVLIVHNSYQRAGGEDSVVAAEVNLLRSNGHQVATYFRDNDDIAGMSKIALATNTLWATRTKSDIGRLVHDFRPDIVHSHNTFPLISPSLYWAAAAVGVPLVQTLHNFRLMCLNGLFLREAQVCEDCAGRVPWRGVLRKCYRDSVAASSVLAGTLLLHRGLGTYRNKVSRYIALNRFCRNKFIESGIPAERIVVKPNFVDYPPPEIRVRHGLLFVGRLSEEKGISTLASAATRLPAGRLRVAGEGPESSVLEGMLNVVRLGNVSGDVVRREMNDVVALVLPSICYENFPRTIVEAFATGLPVIASRIGSLAELVRDGETGLLFESSNPDDLAQKMSWALANPERMAEMGRKARAQYEAEFSSEVNYRTLVSIYQDAIDEVKRARSGRMAE